MFDFALGFISFEYVEAVPRLHILQRWIVQEVEINRLDTQPLQAALDTAADIVRREIPHARYHVIPAFSADEDLIAVSALFEESTDDALAMPGTIGVRGVDKIYSGNIDGRMQGFYTDGIIYRP